MQGQIHFISGLPRSGSTLLAALLRQNPRIRAGMTGPAGSIVDALLRAMSMHNETAVFLTDTQREALVRAVFTTLYADLTNAEIAFDTNRMWCAKLPLLAQLFPHARVICCVRDLPGIFDSVERLIRGNAFQPSGLFGFEPGTTLYSRVEALTKPGGIVGYAWNALREAFSGDQADRLLVVTFDTLTRDPGRALAAIYSFLGLPPFLHDFDNVIYDADEFDRRLGTPGLHRVKPQVRRVSSTMLLPQDMIDKYANDSFWLDRSRNPKGVPVV